LSLQNALNKFFAGVGKLFEVPTASALSQARRKLKPELFKYLSELVCKDFYELFEVEGFVRRWLGHRLVACDGTYLNLPDNEETRAEFFLQTNQFKGGEAVQALSCILYDLLNGLVLGATLGTRTGEKGLLLDELWEKTELNDVGIFDRHYADYKVLATGVGTGREIVVRLPENSFKESQELFKNGKNGPKEKIVELKCPTKAREYIRERGLPEKLTVRFVRVELPDGKIEVLATTLLDVVKYPSSEFKELYGMRWKEETFIGRIKNIFEVERFSGTSPLVIKQDYYGVLFLATLENIFAASDERALIEKTQKLQPNATAEEEAQTEEKEAVTKDQEVIKPHVRQPFVNHAISYLAMIDRVVELLLGKGSLEQILVEMHHLFRMSPNRLRPGRKFERKPEKTQRAKRLKWHKYGKKIIA